MLDDNSFKKSFSIFQVKFWVRLYYVISIDSYFNSKESHRKALLNFSCFHFLSKITPPAVIQLQRQHRQSAQAKMWWYGGESHIDDWVLKVCSDLSNQTNQLHLSGLMLLLQKTF